MGILGFNHTLSGLRCPEAAVEICIFAIQVGNRPPFAVLPAKIRTFAIPVWWSSPMLPLAMHR